MKPLDCLEKRDLLAAKKFDPDIVREYAEEFFNEGLYGDAFAFFGKIEDRKGIERVKRASVEEGNPEILWRIEHADRSMIEKSDWQACGEAAMRQERFRNAAFAFRKSGDAARQAKAEAEFMPPPEEAEEAVGEKKADTQAEA